MKKGFTLIEILVTVTIIGIMASMITINVSSARTKGRDESRKANLQAISSALSIYYAQNKEYPNVTSYNELKTVLVPDYLTTWPNDPSNATNVGSFPDSNIYSYFVQTGGGNFALDARLEKNSSCDSTIVPTTKSDKSFYLTGMVCFTSSKNHYRVSGN